MNLEQSPQFETTNISSHDARGKVRSVETKVRAWQLAIAAIMLLGAGFVLGQKLVSVPTTTTQPVVSKQTSILPVKTTVLKPAKSYSNEQTYTGEVTALRTSEVGFERGGKLINVFVEEGDRLSVGTPLAELDRTNLKAQRPGLVAQKAQAQAVLAELKNGARIEEVRAAQANVRDLQQQLELEKLKSDRREYLYEEGGIAREQLDEIVFNRRALKERLANAQSTLDELKNGTRIEQIEAQQAAVDRLDAEIVDLDITIDKSVLRSPFNGIVAARNLDEGTVVEAGTSILRLVENTQPKVTIGVPLAVAKQMQPGSKQQITIGGKEYDATVSSVLPEVDAVTRTRTVVFRLAPSAATEVSPRQIARLNLTQTKNIDGYWLPINALVEGDRGLWSSYALVDSLDGKNKQAERRYVELLETQEDRVLVRGTIEPGEEIIVDGTHRLVPGQIVKKIGM